MKCPPCLHRCKDLMSSNANSKLKIPSQLMKGNACRSRVNKLNRDAETTNSKLETLSIVVVIKSNKNGNNGFRFASKKSNNGRFKRKTNAEKRAIGKVAFPKLELNVIEDFRNAKMENKETKNKKIRRKEMDLYQKGQIILYQEMEPKQMIKSSIPAMKEQRTGMNRCMEGAKTK